MLRGSLSVTSLPGLLQLLSTERRTGRLDVSPSGRGASARGSVWLDTGAIVHAECGPAAERAGARHEGQDAVHSLVATEAGEFTFGNDVAAPRRTISDTTEHLLVEAACRRDDARRAAPVVTPAAVPAFAPVPEGVSTPRFNTMQWRILAAIDGRKDVTELAKDLGLPPAAACTLVSEMVAAGVVQLA